MEDRRCWLIPPLLRSFLADPGLGGEMENNPELIMKKGRRIAAQRKVLFSFRGFMTTSV